MAKKVTYYAMVDDLSSREAPAGVLRRTEDDQGQQDEIQQEPGMGVQLVPVLLRTRKPRRQVLRDH